ncbi:MAG: hypothetical protein HRT42_12420 [Campylobacteraceae bacterium]|nr:hypothetical protein [Campylobacteraceae bacterium]
MELYFVKLINTNTKFKKEDLIGITSQNNYILLILLTRVLEYTILEFLAYYLWVLYFKTLSILKTLTDVINNPLKYTDSSEYGITCSEYTKDTGAYGGGYSSSAKESYTDTHVNERDGQNRH